MGPRAVLLVYVDDATGKLMELHVCVSPPNFRRITIGASAARREWITTRIGHFYFIRFEGKELSARAFDKDRRVSQGAIVENKLLGAALQHIREQQAGQQEARLASAKTIRDKRLVRKTFAGSGTSS